MAETEVSKSVLAFAAHPDDTELCCAGTLRLLADRGWRITICTLTNGGMGGFGMDEATTIATRDAEARESAAILGAGYRCLGGRDGFLYDTEALRIAAQDLMREVEAGIVIGHLSLDYHADHRAAASITDAATFLATLPNIPSRFPPLRSTPLFYHSSTLGLTDPLGYSLPRPHFFVDVTGVWATKAAMLGCHRSQAEVMRVQQGIGDFLGMMRRQDEAWGSQAGYACAEAYWQHLGGGFRKTPLIQTELRDFTLVP